MLTKIKEHDFIINGAYSKILAMNNYLVRGVTMREVPQRLASPSEETPKKKKKKKKRIR